MTLSKDEAALHRAVGELDAKVGMMIEDIRSINDDLRHSMVENQQILKKLDKVESKLDPLPGTVAEHALKIGKLEQFDGKLMGVVSLASLTISAIGAGFWMLLTHFADVVAFAKKLIGGG